MATGVQVVIDCADPTRLGAFWAEALHYVLQPPPHGFDSWPAFLTSIGVPEEEWNGFNAVVDPDGRGPRLFFQRVPEPKVVKNRLHLDLNVGWSEGVTDEERRDRVGTEVERLTALGASVLRDVDERGEHWVVMQDPEGNEFCVQ
jgi:hypothetical protein